MKTIPFKPAAEQWVKGPGRDPETRTNVNVISWPMKRLTIDVPIDLHIRLKTGCAMRGEKIADVVRTMIEREFLASGNTMISSLDVGRYMPLRSKSAAYEREDRSSQRLRTLVAHLAHSRLVR
jgi:hypothetical protein